MRFAVLLTTLCFLACTAAPVHEEEPIEKEAIQAPGALEGLPFSSAVRVGDILFLSGQIGNLPGTRELAPGGVAAEARQTMENIKAVLEHAGSSMDRVFKCTVFLLNIDDYAAVNEVYVDAFGEHRPARSAVAVAALPIGALFEIEAIARI